jgi:hypothetical protein
MQKIFFFMQIIYVNTLKKLKGMNHKKELKIIEDF